MASLTEAKNMCMGNSDMHENSRHLPHYMTDKWKKVGEGENSISEVTVGDLQVVEEEGKTQNRQILAGQPKNNST